MLGVQLIAIFGVGKEFSSRVDWQWPWRFFAFLRSMGQGSLAGGLSAT